MATSTRAQAAAVADIAGLDRLELGQTPSAAAPGRIVRKAWAVAWPKPLASGMVKGPATTLADLWNQLHDTLLWGAIGTTVQTAVAGYALALLFGSTIG